MRAALAFLILAACSDGPRSDRGEPPAAARIECARAGSATLDRSCSVTKSRRGDAVLLTLTRPDGGFRRLLVDGEGGLIGAADGAEPVTVRNAAGGGTMIEVAGDRFLIPATARK